MKYMLDSEGTKVETKSSFCSINFNVSALFLFILFTASGCATQVNTPLYDAINKGKIDEAQTLIDKKKFINDKSNGATPLMAASVKGYFNVVSTLLTKGAEVNSGNNYGVTALMLASMKNRLDITKLLIEHGADINKPENNGRTSLMLASRNGHYKITQLLLDYKANIDLIDKEGESALFKSTLKGHKKISKLLIQRGADINIKNIKTGTTPFMNASKSGLLGIIKVLKDRGVDINHINKKGESSLHMAADEGRKKILHFLIDSGAKPSIVRDDASKTGKTFRMVAEYHEIKGNSAIASEYYGIAAEQYKLAAEKAEKSRVIWDFENRAEKYRKKEIALSLKE